MKKEELKKARRLWYLKVEKDLSEETKESIDNTSIVDAAQILSLKEKRYHSTKLILEKMNSVAAIMKYTGIFQHRSCILNFASFRNPGGGFLKGSKSQEESLCERSNLYPILLAKEQSFYEKNRVVDSPLYKNDLMYIPGVRFYDLRDDSYISCDVITCAAPNAKYARKIGYDEVQIANELKSRIRRILEVVAFNEVDTLILGAFGCGVFENHPRLVSTIFYSLLLTDFNGYFKECIFAIPEGKDCNFEIFQNVFNN